MKTIGKFLLILGFMMISQSGKAYHKTFTSRLVNPLLAGDTFSVQDDKNSQYILPAWFQDFNNLKVRNNIFIRIDRNNLTFVPHKCTLRVVLDADYLKFTPGMMGLTPFSDTRTVDLVYDTAAIEKETDEIAWVIEDAVNCLVTIVSITAVNGPPLTTYPNSALPVLEAQQKLEIDRIGDMSISPMTISTPFFGALYTRLSWTSVAEAEAYEIQYLHVPEGFNLRNSPAPNVDSLVFDFRHDNTNVIVTTNSYIDLPAVWASGHIVYRVRAWGKKLDEPDRDLRSLWSVMENGVVAIGSGTSTKNFVFEVLDYNDSVNWQFTNSFAEETKIFSAITYFDGTMRERQAVTKSNETEVFTAVQSVFDHLGRQAVDILPSPVFDNNYFALRPGLNQNTSNDPYSYTDFDKDKSTTGEININSMSDASGAGYYYSPELFSNSALNSVSTLSAFEKYMHGFVPDAEGFPMVQTEFRRDNTGRSYRNGSAGKTHQLTSYRDNGASLIGGKETFIWDGTPTQEELDVLFGSDIGYYQFYKKIMHKDENGQLNVSYIDPYGRTIATALAGKPEDAPSLDPISSSDNYIKLDLYLKNSREHLGDMTKQLAHHLLVTQTDTVKFYYDLYRDPVHFPCDSLLCFDCAYDMTISIQDALNNEMIPGGPITQFIGTLSQAGVSCNDTPHFSISPNPIALVLEPGEYTISKTLTISSKALAYYRKLYFDSSSCVKQFDEFLAESLIEQGVMCDWGCEDCDSAKTELARQLENLRVYADDNSLDTLEWEEFINLKAEIQETDSFCDVLCHDISPCEQLYYSMLEDMSLGGQYAKYAEYDTAGLLTKDLNNIDTSIFKNYSKFYCLVGTDTTHRNWRTPKNKDNTTYYLDEDGTEALILVVDGFPELKAGASYVTVDGKQYAKPHELKYVSDFIKFWQEEWASSLVYMHPEYCYYKACIEIEPLYEYEQKLLNTSRASVAMAKGYYNPLGLAGTLDTLVLGGTPYNLNYSSLENVLLVERDPIVNWFFYQSLYPSGVTSRGTAFADSLHKFRYKGDVGGSCQNRTVSIWKLYERMRLSEGLTLTADTCADNIMWPLLRALYLYKRNEWIKTYYDSVCGSGNACPYNYLYMKDRRWVMGLRPSQMGIPANDYMEVSFFSNLETKCKRGDFQGAVDDVVEKNCEDYCTGHARHWMSVLAQCPSISGASQLRKDSIYEALVNVCMGGCDFKNPYGSVNVSYDNYGNTDYPDKHVRDVLKRFRVDLIPGICDDLLINFPGEYDHDYLATTNPDADTCACSKYKQVRYSSRCDEDTTGNMASNNCGCDYENNELRRAVTTFNGVKEGEKCQNCITCHDLIDPLMEFWERYEDYRDSMLTDSATYQLLITNFLNRYFGFNLTYREYYDYALDCMDSSSLSGDWLRAWDILGTEKLVASNDPVMDYQIKSIDYLAAGRQGFDIAPKTKETTLNIDYLQDWYKPYKPVLLASSDGIVSYQSVNDDEADAMNIGCHCEKILNTAKLIENGQNNGLSWNALYTNLYGPFPFDTLSVSYSNLKERCCKLFNKVAQSSGSCSPNNFRYGDYFDDEDDRDFIIDELNAGYIPNPFTIFLDPPAPCDPSPKENDSVYLDTCACKKIKQLKEQWTMNNEGLAFAAYVLKHAGVSADNLDELNDYCEFLWNKGIDKDNTGALAESYAFNKWWRPVSVENLFQHATDFNLKVPRELSCTPSPEEQEEPCYNYISCWNLKLYFFTQMFNADHEDLDLWDMHGNPDEYIDVMDEWDREYPEGGSYTPGSIEDKRRTFLDDLKEKLNAATQGGKCDEEEVYTLEYLFKVMMGCSGGGEIGCMTTKPDCRDIAQDILDFNALLNDPGSPKHTYYDNSTESVDSIPGLYKIPFYDRMDYMLKRYQNYWLKSCDDDLYYRYSPDETYGNSNYLRYYHADDYSFGFIPAYNQPCTQVGNLGMDDSLWLMGFEYYLNQKYNPCFSTTPKHLYSYLFFYWNINNKCQRPKNDPGILIKAPKKPACPNCFVADTTWLNHFTTFLSQVTKKSIPDRLDDYGWYLKPDMSLLSTDHNFSNFYANPILYSNGGEDDLKYKLEKINVPKLLTKITDISGYELKFSLNFPNQSAVWNFSRIVTFINPRARKSASCGAPRYFYIDAVYEVPDKYLDDYPDCPNAVPISSINTKCYDTVTLIGEIITNTHNRGIGKEVSCLGCKRLCNKPYTRHDYVDSSTTCGDVDMNVAFSNALSNYNAYLEKETRKFDSTYIAKCMGSREYMRLKYNNRQYHHTLYYYDQAGNLIKTVPPMGVDIDNENINQAERQAIADERIALAAAYRTNSANPYALTYHHLHTNYTYNSMNKQVTRSNPDGGSSKLWYDKLGRFVVSQNDEQFTDTKYSYIKYDYANREIEAGELEKNSDTHLETDVLQDFEQARDSVVALLDRIIDETQNWDALIANSRMSLQNYSGNKGIKMYHEPCTGGGCIIGQVEFQQVLTLNPSTTYDLILDKTLLGSLSSFDLDIEYQDLAMAWVALGGSPYTITASGIQNFNFTIPGPGSATGSVRFKISFTPGAYSEALHLNTFWLKHDETGVQPMSYMVASHNDMLEDFIAAADHMDVTKSFYNQAPLYSRVVPVFPDGPSNLRGRIGGMTYEEVEDNDSATYDHAFYYNYDIQGNANRLVQDIPRLDFLDKNLYTLDYDFDLISGKIKEVVYQVGQPDRFYHRYSYDKDDRLVLVRTGRDSVIWDIDAKYLYYLHGQLMRTELGDLKVQGTDYAYSINGWLKSVNGPVMHYLSDMGNDGGFSNINLPGGSSTGNPNRYVARDAMAFYLSYFQGDYKASANTGSTSLNAMEPVLTSSDPLAAYRNLYNGNIAMMGTSLPDRTSYGSRTLQGNIMGNVYHYDQLNRLTEHKVFSSINAVSTTWSWGNTGFNGTTKYYEAFSYDANGNIRTLMRNGENATSPGSIEMDDLTYRYDIRNKVITVNGGSITLKQLQNNKLWHVNDAVSSANYSADIDDQTGFVAYPASVSTSNNYQYDELGNLVYDSIEQISEIKWNANGKIKEIVRAYGSLRPDLQFGYNVAGQRLYKIIIPKSGAGNRESEDKWIIHYYVRDISGNVVATYSLNYENLAAPQTYKAKFTINDWQLNGNSRIGIMTADTVLISREFTADTVNTRFDNIVYTQDPVHYETQDNVNMVYVQVHGKRQYELTNHLGNVIVTIQDRKLPINDVSVVDYYIPYILTVSDYYAFGSEMGVRSFSKVASYIFGLNGQLKDDEVYGDGNSYSAEFWQYDARLGRRFNTDPVLKSYESSYACFGNNPIWFVDENGADTAVSVTNNQDGSDVIRVVTQSIDLQTKAIGINDVDFSKAISKLIADRIDLNRVQNSSKFVYSNIKKTITTTTEYVYTTTIKYDKNGNKLSEKTILETSTVTRVEISFEVVDQSVPNAVYPTITYHNVHLGTNPPKTSKTVLTSPSIFTGEGGTTPAFLNDIIQLAANARKEQTTLNAKLGGLEERIAYQMKKELKMGAAGIWGGLITKIPSGLNQLEIKKCIDELTELNDANKKPFGTKQWIYKNGKLKPVEPWIPAYLTW